MVNGLNIRLKLDEMTCVVDIAVVCKGWEFTGPKKSMGIDFDIDFSENCCKLQYKSNLHNFYKFL